MNCSEGLSVSSLRQVCQRTLLSICCFERLSSLCWSPYKLKSERNSGLLDNNS